MSCDPPITVINQGQRVQVVGEQNGWLEIMGTDASGVTYRGYANKAYLTND